MKLIRTRHEAYLVGDDQIETAEFHTPEDGAVIHGAVHWDYDGVIPIAYVTWRIATSLERNRRQET